MVIVWYHSTTYANDSLFNKKMYEFDILHDYIE